MLCAVLASLLSVSLEVGEHVPNQHEMTFVRNLHAHNCLGIVLSWATLGKWGVGHVNNHRPAYLIKIFSALGYHYNAKASFALHANRTHNVLRLRNVSQPWFWVNALVFERITPLDGPGCTPHKSARHTGTVERRS